MFLLSRWVIPLHLIITLIMALADIFYLINTLCYGLFYRPAMEFLDSSDEEDGDSPKSDALTWKSATTKGQAL